LKDDSIFSNIVKLVSVVLAAACLITCTVIASRAFVGVKTLSAGGGLTATGSASCDFESNLIVWRGNFSTYGATTGEAYSSLKRDAGMIKHYLSQNGISEDEMVFSSVNISKRFNSIYNAEGNYVGDEFAGYELSQNVSVTSSDIDKVEKISRDITDLIESGVEFTSDSPEYYYTDLDNLKLQLIADATENAKARIDLMASGSGATVGDLVSSTLGVFQITATNSSSEDYSYGGTFNTSSRAKTATITVRLNYSVR
jgi:hypothetical protein